MVEASCTVCGSDAREHVFVVGRWPVVRCRSCGHRYVHPRPDSVEVLGVYDASYFENPAFHTTDHDACFGYMDYVRDRENIQARLRGVLTRIEQRQPAGRLLDVGCGLGFFVEVANLHGWEAWGVEVNDHAVRWANEHVTERVRQGSASELPFPDESFDCVVLFDVIEHLTEPGADLAEAHRVLRPDGLMVVATPDAGSLMARLLGARWLEMQRAPEHLHFFDLATLSRLLGRVGFAPLEWHTMGKITTVRTMLADLKFYAPRVFGWVERHCERRGWSDRVIDVDPRTKLCLYATKRPVAQHDGFAADSAASPGACAPVRVERRKPVVRRVAASSMTTGSDGTR